MEENQTNDSEIRSRLEGKGFVDAAAAAGSAEELKQILNACGVSGFGEEQLAESWQALALSRNWDAVRDLMGDRDYESCSKKLAALGMTTTREQFDLINEVISAASDDALIAANASASGLEEAAENFRRFGYKAITADFIDLVQDHIREILDDGLMSEEELNALAGCDFYERCGRTIHLIFALSTIAGLALGVSGVADPALLIAIAGGISLMFTNSAYRKV